MSLNVLLVNEDESYQNELIYSFEVDGYNVITAKNIAEAINKLNKFDFDLALIDMIYKDGTGLDLKKKMNEIKSIPTIVVTSVDEDIQKILALEYGADDYLVKPFNILELKARIRAVLRRVKDYEKLELEVKEMSNILDTGDFEFNIVGRKVKLKGKDIELTGKEFDILYILCINSGKVFSREELAREIWGENYEGHLRTVDVHIRRLREKIETGDESYIKTKWGEGYYIEDLK